MAQKFCYIDVFTSTKFNGNPAAVFFESDDLASEIMQKIANELNLSETVFLLKPTDKNADYKARIFTPKTELPFAGHPTIAAAFAYRDFYNIKKDNFIQECFAGLIEIKNKDEIFLVKQNNPQFEMIKLDKPNIAATLGISENEICDLPIEKVSTGIYWIIIALNSAKSVINANPNYQKIIEITKKFNAVGLQIFAKSEEKNYDIKVRTFAPLVGVFEDPGCGSGNGCIAAYIAKYNILKKNNYIANQGEEIGRINQIYASYSKRENIITDIVIGGKAVKVLEGCLFP